MIHKGNKGENSANEEAITRGLKRLDNKAGSKLSTLKLSSAVDTGTKRTA